MTKDRKVLFIGHDATRTGAPLLLLNFLRWLRDNNTIQFEILLREGGPLTKEYEKLAKTRVATHLFSSPSRRILKKIGWEGKPQFTDKIRRLYPTEQYPLVYTNTVTNGSLVRFLTGPDRKVICHAHEMSMAMQRWGGAHVTEMVQHTDCFIAASAAVKRDLIEVLGVLPTKIDVVHEFGQKPSFPPEQQPAVRDKMRASHGFTSETIVVGMCGTPDWRKGADLFPQLAQAVRRMRPNGKFKFLWVGINPDALESKQIMHDVRTLGLEGTVVFVPPVSNPHEHLSAADLFALTSREDPFPLVMLEAAALGLPLICFDRSGGATEFSDGDTGLVIPYLDTEGFARALVKLGEDEILRHRMGQKAKDKATHFSIGNQSAKLLAIIERQLAEPFLARPAAVSHAP